jgi:hypothetical protein
LLSPAPGGRLLRSFTFAVLDALGIAETPAHSAVMLTADGPVLVEPGTRLGGATAPAIVEKLPFPDGLRRRLVQCVGSLRNLEFINHYIGTASSHAAV